MILDELEQMCIPAAGSTLKGISALSAIIKTTRLEKKTAEKAIPVRIIPTCIQLVLIFNVPTPRSKFDNVSRSSNSDPAEDMTIEVDDGTSKRKVPVDVRRHSKKRKQ